MTPIMKSCGPALLHFTIDYDRCYNRQGLGKDHSNEKEAKKYNAQRKVWCYRSEKP